MLVAQILKKKGAEVIAIERHRSIRDAAQLLFKHNIGAVLVRDDDGSFCGIVSERDLARGIAKHGAMITDSAVEALMTRNVITCTPADKSDRLMDLMTERRVRHLPVMVAGEIVGMISIGDIVKARLGELQEEAAALQTYIAGNA